jgi:hemerythrin HHE cation binding domain-containing protein
MVRSRGPVTERENLFRPIHKGVRSMLYRLGSQLQTTDFSEPTESNKIAMRLKADLGDSIANCILCMLRAHSGHEEKDIFAEVRPFDPDIVELMMAEHREIARRILGVSRTCDELMALSAPGRRIEVGDRLNLEANELFALYLAHMNSEEETMVPVMWERFSDDQLRSIRAKFYDNLPLPRFEEWMRWTLPALNMNELVVLYSGLKKAPRSPRYPDWVRLARETLDAGRWQSLTERTTLD